MGSIFLVTFGLNDLLKYMENREHIQQQELVQTLVEIVKNGKKRIHTENLEELFSQSPPPLPEAFFNQLLRLHNQGFLVPSRHERNFYKMLNQRLELMRLKQTYETENRVFYQNELQNVSSDTSEGSRHLSAACTLDIRPLEGFPLFIFGKMVASFSILIPTLLSVAYITLLERKILAFRQFRLGSNRVSWVGILQLIADALKLFSKQVSSPFSSNLFIYVISPILGIFVMLII